MNETFNNFNSIVQLSRDKGTEGFDLQAGKTWIYPTNYPVREYQYKITEAALHYNTLVSLPTGLGKTFIAAVVMYNFFRWYPMGKIIFMAPTKPLVTQQMDACYSITAIPKSATVEMTGSKINTSRVKLWKEKRVFFITPHILQNDIDSVLDLAPQIRCIVIDEAHRALGKNANCEAIKKIQTINSNFRILALSATPGSNFNNVKDVITSLLISHIEVRTNESKDVAPYVFQRKLETIVIPIKEKLLSVKNKFILILDRFTRPLLQFNVFNGNCANLTKGRIILTLKEFKETKRHHANYSVILKSLNICVTLYHGYELLIRHGLRAFLLFFQENISKPLMNSIRELHDIIEEVQNYLGPVEEIQMLPDGTIPELVGDFVFSHPKFEKLLEVLKDHFNHNKEADSKVMIFCEYRESVMEIYNLLLRHRPLIKPRVFLGQSSISQAQQLQAVKMFKSTHCNTLVSTCIGEEGLDVGEVDLIICFDISSKSPIRMVQRMGRTGRKRDGRVVALVTEGKEQQLLSECLVQRNNMNILLESQQIKMYLYKNNPKMIPDNIQIECNKMHITIQEPETKKKVSDKASKKKNNNNKTSTGNTLKNMFENMSQSSASSFENKNIKNKVCSKKTCSTTSPTKNQCDIKSIFSKISAQSVFPPSQMLSEEMYEKTEGTPNLKRLISEIDSYLNISLEDDKFCGFSEDIFNFPEEKPEQYKKLDISILDKINENSLELFTKNLFDSAKNFENVLSFFKLNSLQDLFSDSDDNVIDDDPNIFNKSIHIFQSSNISQTQYCQKQQNTPQKNLIDIIDNINTPLIINKSPGIFETSRFCQEQQKSPKEQFNIENDVLVISDSDTSPILSLSDRISEYKHKIKKKLKFSESTPKKNVKTGLKKQNSLLNFVSTTKKIDISNKFSPIINNEGISSKLSESSKNEAKSKAENKFENTKNKENNLSTKIEENLTSDQNKVIDNSEKLKPDNKFTFTKIEKNKNEENTLTAKTKENLTSDQNKINFSPVKLNMSKEFWDESLFEMCDSDELFEEEEVEQMQNNVNTVSKDNESDEEYDSDETLILSLNSDVIFNNISKEKTKLENAEKIIDKKNEANVTLNGLLSITQVLDTLNDSKTNKNNKSLLETQNVTTKVFNVSEILKDFDPSDEFSFNKNSKSIEENQNESLAKKFDVSRNLEDFEILDEEFSCDKNNKSKLENQNEISLKEFDVSNILKDFNPSEEFSLNSNNKSILQKEKETSTKKFDASGILEDFEPSDEEFSLLSINQKVKNKKAELSEKVPQTIIISDESNDAKNPLSSSLKENFTFFQNSASVTNEFLEESSLLTFSQKRRNKKFKLSTNKTNYVTNQTQSTSQDSPIKVAKKRPNAKRQFISDSDDDFEIKPKRKQILSKITPEKNQRKKLKLNTIKSKNFSLSSSAGKFKIKKKCVFVDDEAVVSDDENYQSDSEEESDDILESSFIHDTQSILDQTDMKAKYLQSVRSPKFKTSGFKMPTRPPPKVYENIYSQEDNNQDDTYMNDSFCVGNDATLNERNNFSYLEMVEAKLEKRLKNEKKRKRICHISSDESD